MFNPRTSWPTAPSKLSARLRQLRREGAYVIDLTESNPTRCDFVYDGEAIRAALGAHEVVEYDPQPKGLRGAREAVAAYYEERGMPIPTDRILLTSGSSEAYAHCFRLLCGPGDEILAPQPSYPLFDFLADITGVELRHYPLFYDNGWSIDFDALKAALNPRTRAILVVTPNNPTGQILSPKERDKLTRLAMIHDFAIIADEVFLDFLWEDGRRAQTFDPRCLALTLTISGLSKISALPQMKLGWITVRGPVGVDADATARLEVMTDTFLSVSTPTQVAARTLLEQRKLVQPQILERIRENLEFLDAKLSGRTPLTRLAADGGWYAVLRAPASAGDEARALHLLEHAGVHVHPGELFGFDREGYLVISLITPHDLFREGVGRVVESID
jgi:aspartate/methionine/tyrosine aminotransferase